MNKIQQRYNRYAYFYDFLEFLPEKLVLAKYRQAIIPKLKGRILEIGVGPGKNLAYYSEKAEVIAVDFSPQMLKKAAKRLKKLKKKNISLKLAEAENLPFPAHSFDLVLATFVFCSVSQPIKALTEIKRVLKKNSQAIFLEHVRSEHKLIGQLQDWLNPITLGIFGCNLNRQTKENIQKAGLRIIQDQKLKAGDILRLFVCLP